MDRAPLDLRPRSPRLRARSVRIGTSAREDLDRIAVDRPAVTYNGPRAIRDSSELFSAAKTSLSPGMRLLDVGCGPRDQAAPAAHFGLNYLGIDFDSPEADLFADAHAIPFRDASFDAALSYAVLEHLYDPFLALSEVVRVLRPGGIFFGTVSQGEPFHESFFHHTTLGLLHALHETGFTVDRLWPSYDTLHALSSMGRYSRATRMLIEAVHRIDRAMPFLSPRAFFRNSPREKQLERLHRAASICFVAVKPPAST
jgi:SAM-dependent methyltransferase